MEVETNEKEVELNKEDIKEDIKQKLKENSLKIFNQIKDGCYRKRCFNIYCNKCKICKEKLTDFQAKNVLLEALCLIKELNKNGEAYTKIESLLCVDSEDTREIEDFVGMFLRDKDYDPLDELINNTIKFPKLNLDLTKVSNFYSSPENKGKYYTHEKLLEKLNVYLSLFVDSLDVKDTKELRVRAKVFYFFQFAFQGWFLLFMHPDFSYIRTLGEKVDKFLANFNLLKSLLIHTLLLSGGGGAAAAESSLGGSCERKQCTRIRGSFVSFEELRGEKKILTEILTKCHTFIATVLFDVDVGEGFPKELRAELEEKVFHLLGEFVRSFDFLHEVNESLGVVDYHLFYNEALSNNLNFRREFRIYDQNKKKKENEKEFSFFSYTWLFKASAKSTILTLFNNQQRLSEMQNSLGEISVPHLLLGLRLSSFNLKIRRNHIIEDTLNEVAKNSENLRRPLKVKFEGEQGVDEGGVRKEFFLLLVRQIFDANYGMFSYNKETRLFWFNLYTFEPMVKYELIGIILGLALFNGVILDVKFPPVVYKKLLGINPCLDDMKICDPEQYRTLKYLLETKEENLKEKLDLTFSVTVDKFGEKVSYSLKENGDSICVDEKNRKEYVDLYIDWYFNESIKVPYKNFETGFFKVFDRNLIHFISPDELELIICGTQILDFKELKLAAEYEEYNKNDQTIKDLWEILLEYNEEEKKKFLFFVTGCDRAPIDGLGSLTITITKVADEGDHLPTSHTCFNNLILPDYKNKEKLKKSLNVAIHNSEGFGLI